MRNEPVAELVLEQMSVGDASSLRVKWLTDSYPPVGTKLYTHPVKELNDGGEPVKNATYWKRQYNLMATQNDNLKSGLYHANEQIKYLESHPVKELTDEEFDEVIHGVVANAFLTAIDTNLIDAPKLYRDIGRAILRKAQEK